jgi:intracellular multiplication protein IcmP
MKGGGGGQQQAGDQISNFFWIIVLVAGVVLFTWWLKREWIVDPVFQFRVYESYLLEWAMDLWVKFTHLVPWLHLPSPNTQELGYMRDYMTTTPTEYVKFPAFAMINYQIGYWTRYPIMLILGCLAIFVYFRHTSHRFQKEYNMEQLKKQESQNWPQITPVLSLDLLKEDLDQGPWAMAKVPLDFCKEHDMLSIGEGEDNKMVWKLKSEPAYRIFALQIGAPWRGVTVLPIHLKALMVIFLARALRQRDVANRFLKQIAASAGHGKLDFSGVEEQILEYQEAKPLKWLENRHAYAGTLFASLLEMARIDGVLASAEFLWLKPVDRRMWYMLNSVGRQTAVVEVAGLFAHWHAEKKLKRPLKNPIVGEAVRALEEEVGRILYIPESEKWQ